jgi:hypothetical protein
MVPLYLIDACGWCMQHESFPGRLYGLQDSPRLRRGGSSLGTFAQSKEGERGLDSALGIELRGEE